MTEAPEDLADAEYDQIEDALLSSVRGRAFLRMRDRRNRVVAIDDVRRLLRDSRSQPEVDPASHIKILRRELQELSSHIAQTRREIASLKPDDPGADRIMLATEELDAILQATEHATTEILNGSERVQAVADRLRTTLPELATTLDNEVMSIMTACSFQDITGQRMTKVVNTLRYIERRVHAMIQIWGDLEAAGDDLPPIADGPKDQRPDAHLLHGPSSKGIDQDAVDALLAGAAASARTSVDPLAGKQSSPTPAATASTAPTKPPVDDGIDGSDDMKPSLGQSAIDDMFN